MAKIGKKRSVPKTRQHKQQEAAASSAQDEANRREDEVPTHVARFLRNIEGIRACVDAHVIPARQNDKKIQAGVVRELDRLIPAIRKGEGLATQPDAALLLRQLRRATSRLSALSGDVLGRSLFVMLFSRLDAFTGDLLAALYRTSPQLLKSTGRQLSVGDVLTATSLEELRTQVVEHEVEHFRRESYVDQFKALEHRFSIRTLRDFPSWPAFIEAAQRRNLIVHCDGRVSRQYIEVCKSEGFTFKKEPKMQAPLSVAPSYLKDAADLVHEVGFKLSQVLWRKTRPNQLEDADAALANHQLELLSAERWALAERIGALGLALPQHSADRLRCVQLINYVRAIKWSGDNARATEIMRKEDWSAHSVSLRLAAAVIADQYQLAASLMVELGRSRDISSDDYRSWPLFRAFRNRGEFRRAYKQVFGEDFAVANRRLLDLERRAALAARKAAALLPEALPSSTDPTDQAVRHDSHEGTSVTK